MSYYCSYFVGTNRYFKQCASRMGIETSFVDCTDAEKVKKSIKPNTKVCVTLSVLSSVNVKKKCQQGPHVIEKHVKYFLHL